MGKLLRSIPSIKGLQEELDLKLLIENVEDGLTSTEIAHALSANQGRVLEEKKLDKTDIVNSTTITDATKVLSAAQGKALADLIADRVEISSIVDALDSTDTAAPLSANQGRILASMINSTTSGLRYKGLFDAAAASQFPAATEAGDWYRVSTTGTVDGLELTAGDMVISNSTTDGTESSRWDKIDNTESADILRTDDVVTTVNQDNNIVTGGAVVNYLNAQLATVTGTIPSLEVETAAAISGDNVVLAHEPLNGVLLDDKVTIYNGDGTYDEWDGLTIVGNVLTITGAAGEYDGKTCKISYLYTA